MSLHISKHQLQHFDFSEVLYLLVSAVLGASLVFLLEESVWDFRTASLKAEVVEQDALLQQYEDESRISSKQIVKLTKSENDLKNERNTLASQLEEIRIESDQLRNQLQAKHEELSATRNERENLSMQNVHLINDAELLSQCVMVGKNLESDTYGSWGKITNAIERRSPTIFTEVTNVLVAFKTFNNSWSYGACSDAYNIAQQYPLN